MITNLLIGAALGSAGLPLLTRSARAAVFASAAGSTLVFILGAMVGVSAFGMPGAVVGGLWYLDPLAGLLVFLVTFVGWTASIAGISYLLVEEHEDVITSSQVRHYGALSALFVFSMLVVVLSNNLGLMWVALEATTLTTVLLVAFYARPGSLEAAWKYLILCSTGIALGLMGVMLTYAAASSGGTSGFAALSFATLLHAAPALSPALMRLSFAFILVGFGTKVGLVPMHAWLPDAHSSAPSPISGMLSGILLTTALFAIIRYKTLVDLALGGSSFTSSLLLAFGALTTLVSALFILVQTDYKRLLAYSSIEHMGMSTFALGLGVPGAFIAVIHLVGHALAKPMLFFGAGNVLHRFKSTKFERVEGVARVLPYTAGFFLVGLLALLALPPSPLFMSEYLLAMQALSTHPLAFIPVALALVIVFAGFARLFFPFLFSRAESSAAAESLETLSAPERVNSAHVAMALHMAALALVAAALFSGVAFPFIERAAATII